MVFWCIAWPVLICACFRLRRYCLERYKRAKHNAGRQPTAPFMIPVCFILFVLLPSLLICATAVSLPISAYITAQRDQSDSASSDPPAVSSPAPSADIQDDGFVLPTTSPVNSKKELFPAFRLSEVEGSKILELDQTLLDGAAIHADQLIAISDSGFDNYIAPYRSSVKFFPFYENLASHFPAGEKSNNKFTSVYSLEECHAQLRGAGAQLAQGKADNAKIKIANAAHHLAIRAGDAMNFAKKQASENRQERTWLYAEIAVPALFNEYIHLKPEGLSLSDWYYRIAQVFDYLGGIADTEELELRMYFLSAVFLRQSFQTLKELQFPTDAEGTHYISDVWNLYLDMLCRVATRVDPATAEGFYREIKQVEADLSDAKLEDSVKTDTAKILSDLDLYQKWGGSDD